MQKFTKLEHIVDIGVFIGIFISGMSSLYTTVALTCIRLLIVKRHANAWLEQKSPKSNNSRYVIMLVWLSSVAVSSPPMFGSGKIDQSMVGVR